MVLPVLLHMPQEVTKLESPVNTICVANRMIWVTAALNLRLKCLSPKLVAVWREKALVVHKLQVSPVSHVTLLLRDIICPLLRTDCKFTGDSSFVNLLQIVSKSNNQHLTSSQIQCPQVGRSIL